MRFCQRNIRGTQHATGKTESSVLKETEWPREALTFRLCIITLDELHSQETYAQNKLASFCPMTLAQIFPQLST